MDRLNHVKIVTPDPSAVDRFLREVVDIPEGWSLGAFPPPSSEVISPARTLDNAFTADAVMAFRQGSGHGGMITGSTESRQFQIFHGDRPHVWAIAIGTRDIEGAHDRCHQHGFTCTEPQVSRWGEGNIRFFFAEAGGIVFEVMRIEPADG
jgi:catechol 2,3-dioxygenase-like lactoylglutathione lyase family enzyme